jgi:hypothetical protein
LLDNFLSELNNMGDETFITKQFFSDALRRFISRYLFVSNLRPDQNISSQILYDDLWDADLFEKEKFWDTDCWMLKNFPLNLRVCNSVKILEIISDNNNGKEGNSIRPSRQNSVKDIKDIKKIMNLRRK